jgi:hypothetical protein
VALNTITFQEESLRSENTKGVIRSGKTKGQTIKWTKKKGQTKMYKNITQKTKD